MRWNADCYSPMADGTALMAQSVQLRTHSNYAPRAASADTRWLSAARKIVIGRIATFLLPALAACGGGDRQDSRATRGGVRVYDSAGVKITVSRARVPPLSHATIEPAPVVLLGSGGAGASFARIVAARVLPSGVIAVADADPGMIRLFDARGRHVRDVGRRGDGPGEFRSLTFATAFGDTLVACCAPGAVYYDLNGVVLHLGPPVVRTVLGIFAGGHTVEVRRVSPSLFDRDRKEVRFLVLDDSVFVADSIGDGARLFGVFDPGSNPFGINQMPLVSPFLTGAQYVAASDALYFSSGRGLNVDKYDHMGTLRASYRLLRARPVVTPAMRQEENERVIARYIEPAERKFVSWVLDAAPPVDSVSLVADMVVSDAGEVWLSENSYPPDSIRMWHVFGPDGIYRGAVSLATSLRLRQVGRDFVVATSTSALGEPVVGVYKLRK